MGNPYVGDAGTFLISTLFGLYILLVMLRFLLQLVRADFYNPISQFIVKATDPPLRPLRRHVPGLAGVDLSTLLLMLGLKFVELWLTFRVSGQSAQFAGLLVISVTELLSLAVNVFLVSILIQVVLSWVNPGAYNPATKLLYSLNEPLLTPARRLIPPISGLDLSPIVVLIAIQLIKILVVAPIVDMGRTLL